MSCPAACIERGTISANRLSADTEGAFARAKLEDEVLSAPPVPRLAVGRKPTRNHPPVAATERDICWASMYCVKRHAGGAGFQQPGGQASLYAPVKVRVRLLLFGLSCGCLRHFFSASVPRKSRPKRLHLDSPLIHSDEPPVGRKRLFPCARVSRLPQTTGWSRLLSVAGLARRDCGDPLNVGENNRKSIVFAIHAQKPCQGRGSGSTLESNSRWAASACGRRSLF